MLRLCDPWVRRLFEALPRLISDLCEPQGLCRSKQGSYPFQEKNGHTLLCLLSLPQNDLLGRLYIQTPYQPAKKKQKVEEGRYSGSRGPNWGHCINSTPPDGTSFIVFIAAPVSFVQGVSEKGKIPAAELKNGMSTRIPQMSCSDSPAAFTTQACATRDLDSLRKSLLLLIRSTVLYLRTDYAVSA